MKKKWTVMLIPHDQGHRWSFTVSNAYGWCLAGLCIGLSFLAGFLLQHERLGRMHAQQLADEYRARAEALQAGEMRPAPTTIAATAAQVKVAVPEAARALIEAELRSEYAERDVKLSRELSRLYELEAQVREAGDLPPRDEGVELAYDGDGGQGGANLFASDVEMADHPTKMAMRLPHVIQGLSSPSADLILQEITTRFSSYNSLLDEMAEQKDLVARVPKVLPSMHASRSISSRFGNRRDPFTKRLRFHGGLDIAADHGSPVLATARGTVVEAKWDGSYGNYVRIDHGNGYETLYGHMSKLHVQPGEIVNRGDQIGNVGSTGRSTAPHIHYEIFVNGKRVDPQKHVSL